MHGEKCSTIIFSVCVWRGVQCVVCVGWELKGGVVDGLTARQAALDTHLNVRTSQAHDHLGLDIW